MNRRRTTLRLSLVTLLAACATGCYERVVRSDGIGASHSDVQPEYRSDTALDRAWDSMFSPPKSPDRSKRFVDSK
ncbi:MAG: hypothetical protein JSR77_03370 [Planctomycetes bacterium]|nr:hypothetical protein [Planctomycetota bacterium]